MFEKTIGHAKDSLAEVSREAIDRAGERLSGVVKEGVSQAGTELKDVIWEASQEIDAKLDKISDEIHAQRQFTNDDVRELVDYAGEKLGTLMDERIVRANPAAEHPRTSVPRRGRLRRRTRWLRHP